MDDATIWFRVHLHARHGVDAGPQIVRGVVFDIDRNTTSIENILYLKAVTEYFTSNKSIM